MVKFGVKILYSCPLLAALAMSTTARAEQFVALDVTYEATSANTMNSEYRVMPGSGVPANWKSPVDYSMGTAHVWFDVLEKPSAAPALLNVCFRNPSSYACMKYSPPFTATGDFTFNDRVNLFWQPMMATMDWGMGVNQVMLVIKDQDEGLAQGNTMYYPYKARVIITLVSPGATYVPPDTSKPSPMAGTGGTGGAGPGGTGGMSGMAGAGGRGGAGGMMAAAGRGGSGGMAAPAGAGAGGPPAAEAGSGSEPEPEPGEPEPTVDASVPEPDEGELPEPPGVLDPQGVGPEPDKRAPPPGGIEGNCAVPAVGSRRDASTLWLLGLAALWLARRRRH